MTEGARGSVMASNTLCWAALDNPQSRLGGGEQHVVGHYRLGEPFEIKCIS